MHVVAALSGGVDSAVAAALLLEAGHTVTGVFLRNGVRAGGAARRARQGCCGIDDAHDAARVAELLGVPFYALDFSREFAALVAEFAAEYAQGRTPNPCITCNRDLKFGHLLDFADGIAADAVATGHYARVEQLGERLALRAAHDTRKDQSYVLFPLDQRQLARTVFPLGGLRKAEVRERARALGLPVHDKPESMEICFVPDGDYRAVVAGIAPHALREGPVVDAATGAVVGRHGGVGSVTLGQRRGFGRVADEPRYVTRVDAGANVVEVGPRELLERRAVRVTRWNAVAAPAPSGTQPLRGRARIRRSHAPELATATAADDGDVLVRFDAPVSAPAPGQALVLYDEAGRVLGGGWMAESTS